MSTLSPLHRFLTAAFFTAAISLAPSSSWAADPKPDDDDPYESAEADSLFKEGVANMLKNDFETACPFLARSLKLDPRLGTLYTLAECEIQWGHTATGTGHLQAFIDQVSALSPAKQDKYKSRKIKAEKRYAEVFPQVPKVILSLPPDAPWTTQITLDGAPLDLRTLSEPHPVNPGPHTLTTSAGGKVSETKISLEKGETKSLVLPVDIPKRPCDPSSCGPPGGAIQGGGCAACTIGYTPTNTEGLAYLTAFGAALLMGRRLSKTARRSS
ncbi:MAG: hypothetical protein IPK82_29725 [Polyangiaceae bacterium]|nr:hypothetical protein [Polyangiaceae bacterium]